MAKGEEKTYDEREREREKHDRRQSEELKEVMKIRRSRKGAYDKRMRRSTRNTTTLILDLVTLTPAAMPLPAYYKRLRTLTRGAPSLQLASIRPDSPPIALFPARYLHMLLSALPCQLFPLPPLV